MLPDAGGGAPEPSDESPSPPDAPTPGGPRRRRPRPSSGPSWWSLSSVPSGGGLLVTKPWEPPKPTCPPVAAHPDWSVARRWDEAMLDAIRRALPNPPVHARNLFHLSVAMWDAWAAYDPTATGYFVQREAQRARTSTAARDEAISYAAYRVLTERFIKATGGRDSLSEFDDVMESSRLPET